MSAHDLLTAAAADRGDRIAVHWVDRDRSLTYAEAADAMRCAGSTLQGFGVPDGGRVGLFAHPGLDYVVAMLGTWFIGAEAALVDLDAKQCFGTQMASVAPDAVIYTNDHFDSVRPAVPDLPTVRAYAGMDGPQAGNVGWLETLVDATPIESPVDVQITDPAIVTFGSDGTADRVTHGELSRAADQFVERLTLGPDDVTLCAVPLATRFHIESSVLAAFATAGTAGMLKTWERTAAWEAMDEHGTTVLCGDATHCRDLLEVSVERGRAPSRLRAVAARSEAAAASIAELSERFGLEGRIA